LANLENTDIGTAPFILAGYRIHYCYSSLVKYFITVFTNPKTLVDHINFNTGNRLFRDLAWSDTNWRTNGCERLPYQRTCQSTQFRLWKRSSGN